MKNTKSERKTKMRILNVGSGSSKPGTDFVDLYPSRREVKKCDVSKEKLPYKNNTFDKVFSSFLFEHLTNPNFALKEMVRVLKKGGEIEIHTNNAGWLFYHNSKSKVKTHYGGYEKGSREKDKHYALYTFHHLKNHLEIVGLTEIQTELYRKGGWSWKINFINWILEHSRFKWASYPQIKITGIK